LTRVSINLRKKMDCRIKSGNDTWDFFHQVRGRPRRFVKPWSPNR